MQEQGTKMYIDAVLKTHERIIQVGFTLQQTLNRHRKKTKEEALFQKLIKRRAVTRAARLWKES